MNLLLLIAILYYLRRNLESKTLLPEWDKIFVRGMIVSFILFGLQFSFSPFKEVLNWVSYGAIFYLIYLSLKNPVFKPVKTLVYAVIPYIMIEFIADLTDVINKPFYEEWEFFFESASFFAFIWMIAMLFVNNKQRKALEKERQNALEDQKRLQISESMKAALEVQVAERTRELMGQKESLEKVLEDLRATQTQLIHAEKMASLGELTAGIAHEIQNPLNFVNNFSEVNNELFLELKEELDNGDIDEVKAIAADIEQNLQKISHHGKRADAIVKGMLQHSRSSGLHKEMTDINALADEYFRLAYHGLRAKDKTFNAKLNSEFDENAGSINVIAQDIGRVILNLITNAFYAVDEKRKSGLEGYEPTVTVSTKRKAAAGEEDELIQISVKDNGSGIPQGVLDKIFQPFFTTKPTGQGTGLGLSMSYDIITAHGGEFKVETKEGEGSEFIILLPVS
ncbi:MAG: histidine kinase [Saprospiraceae bacterium]|nr:histidine kinase [Saprospiraceae bacterium]